MTKDKIFLPWEIIPLSALRPVSFPKISFRKIFSDLSVWFLLLSNFLTIIVAFLRKWDVLVVVWVYLIQIIIIGLFKIALVLTIKELSFKDLYIGDYPGQVNQFDKNLRISLALYVAFYVGIFSLVCGILLLTNPFIENGLILPEDRRFVFFTSFIFFLNHLFSFFYFRHQKQASPEVSQLVSSYFYRLMPLYLMVFGGIYFGRYSLTFFLLAKTVVDVAFHLGEHAILEVNSTGE